MYKIGICGAHGTGKTTLAAAIAKNLNITHIAGTMRNMWQNFGVEDFEKMPVDSRSIFQNYALLEQITTEKKAKADFVTDRTVLDVLGYTILSSDMQNSNLEIFKTLVFEWLKNYTHLIYVPVEFEVSKEKLRADISSREKLDSIYQSIIKENQISTIFLSGDLESRLHHFLKNLANKENYKNYKNKY